MSKRQEQPATVILRSYWPLCPGQASVVEEVEPGRVNELVREVENSPPGQAEICLWADHERRPTPVFVLERGRDIARHLTHWSEGNPSEWFKLHLVQVGRGYGIALVPDLEQTVESWKLACLEERETVPPDDAAFSVFFRPLFFLAGVGEVFAQVKERLGAASWLGLLDASEYNPGNPSAARPEAVAFIGPFALEDDPSGRLEVLFSTLLRVRPPPPN